jgi:uncharacterized protein YyaL (SSP411 family)
MESVPSCGGTYYVTSKNNRVSRRDLSSPEDEYPVRYISRTIMIKHALFRIFCYNYVDAAWRYFPLRGIMRNGKELKDEIARIRTLIELDKSSLPPDGGAHFNRLIFSRSPYLLQHADNPVDWYPWSEEAFDKARREDKPIFLSIGYSTCHWCHVMEEESFTDREAASIINKYVVPVKVDREERPDIDTQYMKVVQLMTGRGGWPLNIIMTPDGKPFYAATYIPKFARMGVPGIIELLEKISELWRSRRDLIFRDSAKILDALRKMAAPSAGGDVDHAVLGKIFRELEQMFDPTFGGFGGAPKFPMPLYCAFLLRSWWRSESPAAREMVLKTLRAVRAGGIYDQIGHGIHRYAVDREWLVPHFEKMLYDQALVGLAYHESFQAFGDLFCKRVAEETFDFVLREMTSSAGGFFSGLDADSEGEEGKYYLWSIEEVREALGGERAQMYCGVYDITEKGNYEGRNIPHLKRPLEQYAETAGISLVKLETELENARKELLNRREKRIRPFRDEKVLTAWNGLMIAALARGSNAGANERFLSSAEKAAAFVMGRSRNSSGRLFRSWHLGEASVPAFLEDYAFLAWGLIELYEATGKSGYLNDALRLTVEMVRLFRDDEHGGFYDTGSDAEEVLIRMKGSYDDVVPSGNSVAALNLVKLGKILRDDAMIREGERTLRAFKLNIEQQPSAYPYMLNSFDYFLGPDVEITIARSDKDDDFIAMLQVISQKFIPNLVLRFVEGDEDVSGFKAEGGRTTAYICAKGACSPPATGRQELQRTLDEVLS